MRSFIPLAFLAAFSFCVPAFAQDARTETVRFESGATGTTLTGTIKGYETVNYMVGAAEGQSMAVILRPDNASSYFNIFEPGRGPGDQAMFIGDVNGLEFAGTLLASGDYTIQVFMMRNAARRDEVSNYTLEIAID